ncbi:MAG: PPC domain-containing protein, partial [Myxococcota bacterium]
MPVCAFHRAPIALLLLLAGASCPGCGGTDPHLEPRFDAVHNALIAAGMSQSGPTQRGSLDEGAQRRLQVRFEGGLCHTLVVLGSGTVRDVNVRVRDEGGEEVATDATDGREAAVRVCPAETSEFQVVVHMARGQGAFVVSSWSGAASDGAGTSVATGVASMTAGDGVGTCSEPHPLELGRPVEGDTRRGRGTLDGTCGRGSAPEQVYRFELAERSQVSVRLQATFDAVVYLLDGCEDEATEKACNDDAEQGETGRSAFDVTVDAGTWFVVVDGYRDEAGDYELVVSSSELPPIDEVCRDASELHPGQPTSGTTTSAPDQFQASCAGGSQSPDRVYRIDVPQRSRLRVRQETDHDGSLYLRADCEEPRSELVCNDDHVDPQHAVVT